jgi:hypothetical protein
VASYCEQCNETSGYITGGEFVDQLRNCQLLYKYSAPWSQCCITDGLVQSTCNNVQYSACFKKCGHVVMQMVAISSLVADFHFRVLILKGQGF